MLGKPKRLKQFPHIQRILREIFADLYIFPHRQIRHEIVELENKAQTFSPVVRERVPSEVCNLLSVHYDRAGINRVKTPDTVQKGRFAGTARSLNHTHRSLRDARADAP